MAARQITVRKSATAGDAASCRAAFGAASCFRFWECRSLGEWEVLATRNTKVHKESA